MAPDLGLGHRDAQNPENINVSGPWRSWVLPGENRVTDLPNDVFWNPVGLPEVKLAHLHVKPRHRILKSPTQVIGVRAARRLSRSVWDNDDDNNNDNNNNDYPSKAT